MCLELGVGLGLGEGRRTDSAVAAETGLLSLLERGGCAELVGLRLRLELGLGLAESVGDGVAGEGWAGHWDAEDRCQGGEDRGEGAHFGGVSSLSLSFFCLWGIGAELRFGGGGGGVLRMFGRQTLRAGAEV